MVEYSNRLHTAFTNVGYLSALVHKQTGGAEDRKPGYSNTVTEQNKQLQSCLY